MLALYDKMMKAPDDLTVAPPLYIEKTQLPLALIQMTDEEMVIYVPLAAPVSVIDVVFDIILAHVAAGS